LRLGFPEIIELGERILTVGFPAPRVNCAASGQFEVSIELHGGISGAPILNEFGEVIGLLTFSLAVGAGGRQRPQNHGALLLRNTCRGPSASVAVAITDHSSTRPQLRAGAAGIVNSTDGTANYKPGSFITVNGINLAPAGIADALPVPAVLGGSCVVFNDVALPLLQTSGGQMPAQIPDTVRPGLNVVRVRSLAMAQRSDPVVVTVQRPEGDGTSN
jgi:hypothetical protein